MNMQFKNLAAISLSLFFFSCLQTRSDLGANQQSQVYHKKNAENQNAEAETVVPKIDERDELIRTLNGRVESLEGQLQQIQKEKQTSQSAVNPDTQKIALLQEALAKMELQLQRLEGSADKPVSAAISPSAGTKSSDANVKIKKDNKPAATVVATKKQNPFEIAETHFQSKEWKKAILSYQAYVEEFPKGKSVAEAKYKIGVCFQELGLKDEASAFYEEVVAGYAKTESGKKAKIRLSALNSKKSSK